jgi:RluA family pseudouridine synthase
VEAAFDAGFVQVFPNQKSTAAAAVGTGHILRQNERVLYKFHRHEPEVLATNVVVLHQSEAVVVVRKPATIPMHPIGRFSRCSMTEVLKAQHPALGPLRITHRLDRLVSGLLILARTKHAAATLVKCFALRQVKKTYLARVKGAFPAGVKVVSEPLGLVRDDPPEYGPVAEADGGKPCRTTFERLRVLVDGTSLVWCRPTTGRTHQIRVHLKVLGHPISNDPKYGGSNTDLALPPPPPPYAKEPLCAECQQGGWKSPNPDDPTILSKGVSARTLAPLIAHGC